MDMIYLNIPPMKLPAPTRSRIFKVMPKSKKKAKAKVKAKAKAEAKKAKGAEEA